MRMVSFFDSHHTVESVFTSKVETKNVSIASLALMFEAVEAH